MAQKVAKKLIFAANWKMQLTEESITHFLQYLKNSLNTNDINDSKNKKIIIFPPAVYIKQVVDFLKNHINNLKNIKIGAQDCSEHLIGAYTGEISAPMLRECGCDYVLIGHSERRKYHHETTPQTARKIEAASAAELTPILCIGETLETRHSHQTEKVLINQLQPVFNYKNKKNKIIIAYEPVWAIGTGQAASIEQIQTTHQLIRSYLTDQIPILYGGSLSAKNATEILALPEVDGGLIGSASLKFEEFSKILKI